MFGRCLFAATVSLSLITTAQAGDALSPHQLARQSASDPLYAYKISDFQVSLVKFVALTLDKKPRAQREKPGYSLSQACRTAFEYENLLVLDVYVRDEDGIAEDIFQWDCLSQSRL